MFRTLQAVALNSQPYKREFKGLKQFLLDNLQLDVTLRLGEAFLLRIKFQFDYSMPCCFHSSLQDFTLEMKNANYFQTVTRSSC